MIAANELRLGNWIKYNNHPSLSESVRDKPIQVDLDELLYILSDKEQLYEPIPLSTDILEKAGFEFDYVWQIYKKHPLYSRLEHNGSELICIGSPKDSGNICCSHIQYLHQLQNLYFALTQTELTINL